jgi:hypothetical protein
VLALRKAVDECMRGGDVQGPGYSDPAPYHPPTGLKS